MKSILLTLSATALLTGFSLRSVAQIAERSTLTDAQKAQIKEHLADLGSNLKTAPQEKNTNLTAIFLEASKNGRAAVDFYFECVKDVDFDRSGLRESDFREWKNQVETPQHRRYLRKNDSSILPRDFAREGDVRLDKAHCAGDAPLRGAR